MKVEKLIEHKDGSATVLLEMNNEEMRACIEEGFISMLKKSIDNFKETCPDATEYIEQSKKRTKKSV